MVILCGECTLIYPNGKQRKPAAGEKCEVCGKPGYVPLTTKTGQAHSYSGSALRAEAIASTRLDGETISIDGPVTVGEIEPKGKPKPIAQRKKLLWVGVDLDGTIATPVWTPENPTSEIGDPIPESIKKLRELADNGYKIIIHTSRPWTDYEAIENYMLHYGIPFREIQCGKPLYAAYIDDRAIRADDSSWLPRGN